VVSRAVRDGQEVRLAELQELDRIPVDMETVVIVGSSRTQRCGDWLLTLRDERSET
jgi:precorrin-3B methylase